MKILKTFCLFLVASSLSFAQIQFHSPTGGQVVLNGNSASAGVSSINGNGGTFTFTGGVTCTLTTCNFTGAGITSINSQTGPTFSIVGDSSLTVTTTTNQVALHATGTGGSGVQYNPTTTAYFVTSFSGLYDDSDSNSRSLGVPSSVSCTGSGPYTCTVNFASAHGLAVSDAVDMSNLSSWPINPIAGEVQQAAQYGSFQVTTVPTTTQITFTTPTSLSYTCSPCTGNAYDASLWGIWQFAKQPYIYGHGTVYGLGTPTQTAAARLTTWAAGVTATPLFLIDQTGQNDLVAGRTVEQIEADHQTLWAAAHTAGMTVVQTTMVPAGYGIFGFDIKPGQINYWLWTQSLSKTATQLGNGQYIDRYVDTASDLLAADSITSMPNPSVNQAFAQSLNKAFGAQNGIPSPPPMAFTYSSSGLASDLVGHYTGRAEQFYDRNWNNWMTWTFGATEMYLYTLFHANGGIILPSLTSNSCLGTDASGNIITGTCGGTTTNALTAAATGGAAPGTTFNGGAAVTLDYHSFGSAGLAASNTFSGATTNDFSGTSQLKLPVAAGYASLADGEVGYDATNKNWHARGNGVDNFIPVTPVSASITNGYCAQFALISGVVTIVPASGACTTSGSAFTLTTLGTSGVATYTGGILNIPQYAGTGTSISQNSGSAETNLPITGFMPQFCSDTSGSGTAQSCTVANTFVPQTGNTIVYSTTTTNSGTGLTINVNSLGAKSVAIPGSSGWTTTLTANIIPANKPLILSYDGTNWNMQQTGTVSAGGADKHHLLNYLDRGYLRKRSNDNFRFSYLNHGVKHSSRIQSPENHLPVFGDCWRWT